MGVQIQMQEPAAAAAAASAEAEDAGTVEEGKVSERAGKRALVREETFRLAVLPRHSPREEKRAKE